ncbi:MAG: potassium-transporting ATPase subunit KdpC [Aeromonadaceae bacterium]
MLMQFGSALRLWFGFTLLLGLVYPLAMTGVAQWIFPTQANGSLLYQGDRVVGSRLVGQNFDAPGYFWSRPSAVEYKGDASGGSNLGPLNPELQKQVAARIARLQQGSEHSQGEAIPVDLVTTSGSGLDPHLSPAALYYQVARVAKARGLPADQVEALVTQQIERPLLGALGEPVVNVLLLNLALDELQPPVASQARK